MNNHASTFYPEPKQYLNSHSAEFANPNHNSITPPIFNSNPVDHTHYSSHSAPVSIPNQIPRIESIFIELTNICNFHCSFCASDQLTRPRQMMDKQLVFKILDDVGDLGLRGNLLFHVMGEPMLHSDLLTILRYNQKTTGLKPELVTNGSLITDSVLDSLKEIELKQITLSWQTGSDDTFQEYRRPGNLRYSQYLEKINCLFSFIISGKLATKLEIDMLVSRYFRLNGVRTIETLGQAREFTKSVLKMLKKINQDEALGLNLSLPKLYRYHLLGHELVRVHPSISIRFRPAHAFAGFSSPDLPICPPHYCHLPSYQLVILADGRVVLCCLDYDGRIVLGDISRHSIREIWLGDKAESWRKKILHAQDIPSICRICQSAEKQQCRTHTAKIRHWSDRFSRLLRNH